MERLRLIELIERRGRTLAEGKGRAGEEQRVRGVISAAKIKHRYDGRRVDPGMTPERSMARFEEDVWGLLSGPPPDGGERQR